MPKRIGVAEPALRVRARSSSSGLRCNSVAWTWWQSVADTSESQGQLTNSPCRLYQAPRELNRRWHLQDEIIGNNLADSVPRSFLRWIQDERPTSRYRLLRISNTNSSTKVSFHPVN